MNRIDHDLNTKKLMLFKYLKSFQNLAVAFSGGVDSTLLLAAAHHVLGSRAVAMTARSPTHPARELALATEMATQLGVRHIVFDTHEMADADFTANGAQRCYHCKRVLFGALKRHAKEAGINALAHGVNQDDLSDFRPGLKAAEEMGVLAPLVTAGLTKVEIRQLARQMGLGNWERPAMACLATRIAYGTEIKPELLARIDAAEEILWRLGVPYCRVRHHGPIARIEVLSDDVEKLASPDMRGEIVQQFRALGYEHVTLDLEGYLSGKMNRELND